MKKPLALAAALAVASLAFVAPAAAGGYRVCNMYATTEGGQYGADCAGWARNLHEGIQWVDNRNTAGALAARGIAPRGGAYVTSLGGSAPVVTTRTRTILVTVRRPNNPVQVANLTPASASAQSLTPVPQNGCGMPTKSDAGQHKWILNKVSYTMTEDRRGPNDLLCVDGNRAYWKKG